MSSFAATSTEISAPEAIQPPSRSAASAGEASPER